MKIPMFIFVVGVTVLAFVLFVIPPPAYVYPTNIGKSCFTCKSSANTKNVRTSSNPHDVNDARANLYDIMKECTLLEDHLNLYNKRCPGCIVKHLTKIQALSEEGKSLDVPRVYWTMFNSAIRLSNEGMRCVTPNMQISGDSCDIIGDKFRNFRRDCTKYYFRYGGGQNFDLSTLEGKGCSSCSGKYKQLRPIASYLY